MTLSCASVSSGSVIVTRLKAHPMSRPHSHHVLKDGNASGKSFANLTTSTSRARLHPQGCGNGTRVDTESAPPSRFVASAMDLAMMNAAKRDGELVAYFST